MNWEARIESYVRETGFPLSLFIGGDGRVCGTWIMGQNYTVKSTFYGGYPHGYLRRVKALFPDKQKVLHLFSGKVDTETFPGVTVDINPANRPDIVDDAQTLKNVPLEEFDLVLADPPYSVEDCDHYQTTMVKRNLVMRALGERLKPGAHVVWLDQVLPMFRKDQFEMEAVIGMVKSTNHRFRVITIFSKKDLTDKRLSFIRPSTARTGHNSKHTKTLMNKETLILLADGLIAAATTFRSTLVGASFKGTTAAAAEAEADEIPGEKSRNEVPAKRGRKPKAAPAEPEQPPQEPEVEEEDLAGLTVNVEEEPGVNIDEFRKEVKGLAQSIIKSNADLKTKVVGISKELGASYNDMSLEQLQEASAKLKKIKV